MKNIIFLLLINFTIATFSQSYHITYQTSFNNKISKNTPTIHLLADTQLSKIFQINEKSKTNQRYFYTDYKSNQLITSINLDIDSTIYKTENHPDLVTKFNFKNEKRIILGKKCYLAEAIYKSNLYKFWYTNDLSVKGSPKNIGNSLGLVLEIEINNATKYTATSITKNNDNLQRLKEFKPIEESIFDEILLKSKFTNLEIFKNDTINFTTNFSNINNFEKFAKGTVIVKKIKIPKLDHNSQVFLDLNTFSQGDAYDRTGSVFLILPNDQKLNFYTALKNGIKKLPEYKTNLKEDFRGIIKTENYEPPIELMRFFTPFGIDKYNDAGPKNYDWLNSVNYRQEISEFNNLISEKDVFIGVYIANYDALGHNVSLNISIHENLMRDKNPKNIIPLFNTLNILEMEGQNYSTLFGDSKGLEMTINLKEDINNAQLRFITTGHGGWVNGDEFIKRKHIIKLNDKVVFENMPWRTDCGSYRNYNPASGNFDNGLSSSDLSRSNWCPGSITLPNYIWLGNLKKGKNKLSVQISQGQSEGNNISYWNVSGILLGD